MTTEPVHPVAPDQIVPQSLNDYLEIMTKAVFQSGLSWSVVTSKWPGFQAGFQGFDVNAVAAMGEPEIDVLAADTAIVRNRRKIAATVHNAQRLIELDEEYDGIGNYMRSHDDFYAALKDIASSSNTWETPARTSGSTCLVRKCRTTRSSAAGGSNRSDRAVIPFHHSCEAIRVRRNVGPED